MPKARTAKDYRNDEKVASGEPEDGEVFDLGQLKRGEEETVTIKPINLKRAQVRIEGTASLVTHPWTEKMIAQLLASQQGKKQRIREQRDPEAEFKASSYWMSDGSYGIPLTAIKASIIGAANKDLGVTKVAVRKALFIEGDEGLLIRLDIPEPPVMRTDIVRVGMGSPDLRFRPEHKKWSVMVRMTYDADLLSPETIFNLLERAGFGVGLCEWRPEKGGQWGTFRIARPSEDSSNA